CPNGICKGPRQPTCSSENGIAFSGRRFLQLVELFGEDGLGGGDPDDEFADNVTICVDDFSGPLQEIENRLTKFIGRFCLEKRPSCLVLSEDGESTTPCTTQQDFEDAGNYALRLQLLTCAQAGISITECQSLTREVLSPSGYTITEDNACSGGYIVNLAQLPPANARVTLEYLVGGPEAPAAPTVPQEADPAGAGGGVVDAPAPGE
ncbi:MAG: hypothetical protein ACE366_00950, partial [Bradymonadia bacterium]